MASERLFSRRGFLGVLAGDGAASDAGSVQLAGGTPAAPTGAPAKPAEAAKPADAPSQRLRPAPARHHGAGRRRQARRGCQAGRGGPVVVWQPLDYLPEVTSLMNDAVHGRGQGEGLHAQLRGAAERPGQHRPLQGGGPGRHPARHLPQLRLREPVLAHPGPDPGRLRYRQPGQEPAGRLLAAGRRHADLRRQVLGRPDGGQLLAVPRSPGSARQGRPEVPEELGRGPRPGQAADQGRRSTSSA